LTVLAKVYAMPELEVGSKVWISFNKEKLHLFDKKTQKAIL